MCILQDHQNRISARQGFYLRYAVGHNLRLVLAWLRILLRLILLALCRAFAIQPASVQLVNGRLSSPPCDESASQSNIHHLLDQEAEVRLRAADQARLDNRRSDPEGATQAEACIVRADVANIASKEAQRCDSQFLILLISLRLLALTGDT